MTRDKLEKRKVALSASLCGESNSLVSRCIFFIYSTTISNIGSVDINQWAPVKMTDTHTAN